MLPTTRDGFQHLIIGLLLARCRLLSPTGP